LPFTYFGVIHVMTAPSAARRRFNMTFTIDGENNITAHGTPEEAAATNATPFDSFSSQKELVELAQAWPTERLVAIWNSLPGVTPVKKFKDYKTAISRVWKRIQGLGEPDKPKANRPERPKAERKAKRGAPSPKGAPAKSKAAKKATPGNAAPKQASAHGHGSKTAQVVAMLQRKNGATLTEITDKMGWQKHTVRGFMAGAMKKAGYEVESFKSDKGERTYRINP
jgi:hypothetical protein